MSRRMFTSLSLLTFVEQVPIVLCGAGRIGNVHLTNILSNRRIKLVSIVDPVYERAKDMADSVGCSGILFPYFV